MSNVMPTYFNRLPVAFERGQGVWLWDTDGNQYLDGLNGIAVTSLGHSHPTITATIAEQAGKLLHTSNTYRIPNQEKLAEKLAKVSGMEQVFFCNSGAESVETAIKITRMYARKKNIAEPQIVVMENGFHGRSMGALSASNDRIRLGFEPLLPGFIRVPYDDIQALETLVKETNNIVAVMLEPIQGESGIRVPHANYLTKVQEICREQDWLFIVDEIQTGIGRTGKWFAFQYENLHPDIVTVAKALGNGIPIGACLASGKACNLFSPGKHGSTFGGNPFACAVGLSVLNTMEKDKIIANAAEIGSYLQHGLREALQDQKAVIEVRGKGLLIGIELIRPCRDLLEVGLKHRILFNITADKVIRLLPALIITREEADEIIKRLAATIEEYFSAHK